MSSLRSLLALAGCLAGCASILGIEEGEPRASAGAEGGEGGRGGTGDAAATTGPGGGTTCECAPPPDDGWEGPSCVDLDAQPGASCGAAWPTELAAGHHGAVGGPAVCGDCSCTIATPGSCTASIATPTSCAAMDSGTVTLSGCTTIGLAQAARPRVTYTPAACAEGVGEVTSRPPAFPSFARICAPGESLAACDDGPCLPQVPSCRACIWRAGDVGCPFGPYAERTVLAASFDDERGCSCSCETATGSCVGYAFEVCSTNCTGCQALAVDTCKPADGSPWATAQLTATGTVSGETCGAEPPVAMGSVENTAPITVCCVAE